MTPYSSRFKSLALILLAAMASPLLTGCADKPTTAQADKVAACIVSHASPERLRAMGETYAMTEVSGVARGDAWECGEGRWGVALSPAYREAIEPAMGAELRKSPTAREGMYAVTFGTQFSKKQQVVIGKLGSFLDEARRATLLGLSCGVVEPQAVQVVGRLDLPFAIAVLGVQANIGEPKIAQAAADKLLERVNLLMSDDSTGMCDKDNGKAAFLRYAQEMHQFYQGQHPWAPGCGIRQEGEDLNLVCKGTGADATRPK
jgi:hypothetical protein